MWTASGSMWTCPPTTSPAGTASCWWKATRPGRIRPRRPPPSSKNYLSLARQSKKRRTPSAGRPRTACLLLPPDFADADCPLSAPQRPLWASGGRQRVPATTGPRLPHTAPRVAPVAALAASDWICSYRINCMIGKIVKKGGFDHRQAKQQPADQNGTYPGFPRQNDPSGICVSGKRKLFPGR